MSGNASDTGVVDVKEEAARAMEAKDQEMKKTEAKSFLEALYLLNDPNNPNSMIVKITGAIQGNNEPCARKVLLENANQIEKIFGLFGFLSHYKKTDARLKHDLNNIATAVEGFLAICLLNAQEGVEVNLENLSVILIRWGRYLIGVEDILLRIISEDEILPEYNVGVNLSILGGAINFFSNYELLQIRNLAGMNFRASAPDSAYKEVVNKKFDPIFLDNLDKINKELDGRQITGNTGLVGNFLLNALRNSLKDRVEANHICLNAEVKGDYFVLRIEDDGKGIASKFLQKDYKEKDEATGEEKSTYIFHEGASGTGSTGIGLANFDTRLASVGGELYVVSKPKYVKEKGLVRFQYGSTPEKAETIEFDESLEHGTVFEIRLPITEKQK